MKIAFVETEPSERELFRSSLADFAPSFVPGNSTTWTTDAEIVCTYLHFPVNAAFLDAHPRLRLVATRSTGYDHIDLAQCAQRGVAVANVAGADDNTVAEHTFALILALSRRLVELREANKQPRFRYETLRGFDLKGQKSSASSGRGASGCGWSASPWPSA